jgi:hypothetical protein
MPFNVWLTIRFAPGGHSSFCSFLNSAVHVVMYLYYGLAAIGPRMQPYLTWKKYITNIQLTQFVLVFVHSFQLLFRDCDYPRVFMAYIGFYAVIFLFLFLDFHRKAYSSPKSASASSASCPSRAQKGDKSGKNGSAPTSNGHSNGSIPAVDLNRNLGEGLREKRD